MSNESTFELIFSSLSNEVFEGTAITPEGRFAVEERAREVSSSESEETPPISAPWSNEVFALVDKVARGAPRITDQDVDTLRGGLTDAEIFEIVVTAAIASGRQRIKLGLSLVANAHAGRRFNAA